MPALTSTQKRLKQFRNDVHMIRKTQKADPPTSAEKIEADIGRMGMGFGLRETDILIQLLFIESRSSGRLDARGKEYLKTEIDRLFNAIYPV